MLLVFHFNFLLTTVAQPSIKDDEAPAPAGTLLFYENPVRAKFLGYELGTSVSHFQIHSNIPQINGLKPGFLGGTVGGVFANAIGKLKANLGYFRTDASAPYSIDLLRAAVSGNVYVLRLSEVKAHLFEPYVSLGVSYQQARFYGNYLKVDNHVNQSVTEQPYLGRTGTAFGTFGVGVEYQMKTDELKFVHLFLGATYSTPLSTGSSDAAFSKTELTSGVSINAGVSFGIIKY